MKHKEGALIKGRASYGFLFVYHCDLHFLIHITTTLVPPRTQSFIMHILFQLHFLVLALFSPSALAATIPPGISLTTPTDPLSTTVSLNATSKGNFVCNTRGTSFSAQEPVFADCAGALRSMSLNPNVGTFFNTGRGDFQIPYFHTYRTCTVIVDLRSSLDKVQSSWLAVHVAALELNEACQEVRKAPGLSWGYTYLDGSGAMRISLKGPT